MWNGLVTTASWPGNLGSQTFVASYVRCSGDIRSPRKADGECLCKPHVHGDFHQDVEACRERTRAVPGQVRQPWIPHLSLLGELSTTLRSTPAAREGRIDGACNEKHPCPADLPSLQPSSSAVRGQVPLVPVAYGPALWKQCLFVHRVPSAFVSAVGAAMTRTLKQTAVAELQTRAYAALPWRMSSEGTMEVLLLCARKDGRWATPQGAHLAARTGLRSAERAAFHDAGVAGRLGPESVGRYSVHRELACGRKEYCEVNVFGLHVWGTLTNWPSDRKLLRRWMDLEEARQCVAEPGLAAVLSSLIAGPALQVDGAAFGRTRDAVQGDPSGVASPAGTAGVGAC